MRRFAAVFSLILLTMPAQAQQMCGLNTAKAAAYINGTWQLDVVAAKVIAGKVTHNSAKGSREIVTMSINQTGAGTLKIEGTSLLLRVRRPGTSAIREKPEHFKAFMTAVGTLKSYETAAMQGCALGKMLQVNARLQNSGAAHEPQNQIESVALENGLFAGAQVVKVPGAKLNAANAPDIRIVSALVMRRLP